MGIAGAGVVFPKRSWVSVATRICSQQPFEMSAAPPGCEGHQSPCWGHHWCQASPLPTGPSGYCSDQGAQTPEAYPGFPGGGRFSRTVSRGVQPAAQGGSECSPTHKTVNLLKTLRTFFIGICVFNVWPKITLLPVWLRDAKGWTPLLGLSP